MNNLVAAPTRAAALGQRPVGPTERLKKMLTWKRPAGSPTEREFIERFIAPVGAYKDEYGNYWHAISRSKVLWSCHTDTVHSAPGRQQLRIKNGIATAINSSCLGADCTTGIWIMLEMIEARVPGCYVFHRAEERGGLGSSFVAKHYGDILKCYDYAIAFDRRETDSIITHQAGQRCASNAFAKSIAPMLPGHYRADSGGLFTDTANYVDHISECTNLSVGYSGEHGPRESQDLAHALTLRNAMIKFDESKLVFERDKTKREYDESAYGCDWLDRFPTKPRGSSLDDYRDLLDFCRSHPDAVADFLETQGFTIRDLEDWSGC